MPGVLVKVPDSDWVSVAITPGGVVKELWLAMTVTVKSSELPETTEAVPLIVNFVLVAPSSIVEFNPVRLMPVADVLNAPETVMTLVLGFVSLGPLSTIGVKAVVVLVVLSVTTTTMS